MGDRSQRFHPVHQPGGGWIDVTMADVARVAGVSQATVSRVINGGARVSEESREAVLRAIQTTGYVENTAARQLAGGAPSTVGLLLRDPRNPVYGSLHGMLQLRTSEAGFQLLTVSPSFHRGGDQEQTGLHNLLALRVAGLLVATGVIEAEDLLPVNAAVPTVVLGRPETHPELDVVGYDEDANAAFLVDAVIRAGHTDIAVVVPERSVSLAEHHRASAMVRGLRQSGRSPIVIQARQFGASDDTTTELLDRANGGEFTVIMFPTDLRALRFMEAALPAGIGIPEDLSVTGADGITPGIGMLGLCTVRLPVETVARRGVDVLSERIASRAAGEQTGPTREMFAGAFVPGPTLGGVTPSY